MSSNLDTCPWKISNDYEFIENEPLEVLTVESCHYCENDNNCKMEINCENNILYFRVLKLEIEFSNHCQNDKLVIDSKNENIQDLISLVTSQ